MSLQTPTSSSAVVTELSQLDPEGSYTYADYLLWQFQERVELIRGRLFPMSPAPNMAHQGVSMNLSGMMWRLFHKHACRLFAAPFDVRLPIPNRKGHPTTVVQPDLCVVCDPAKLDEQGCNGAPDLVIEILSPGNSTREMREKFRVYEEAGVREYWLVNPLERVVLIFVLDAEGVFIGKAPVTEEDPLRSYIFPELTIDLKEVFA